MSIVTDRQFRQALSAAAAERSSKVEDIVSKSVALYNVIKEKGNNRPFSGPEIRQTIQFNLQQAQWASGYDFLKNPPVELLNDAMWTPKSVYVPMSLTGQEIRANRGRNQAHDLMRTYFENLDRSMVEAMDAAMHGDGTADGGKAMIGLAGAVPIVTNTGVYGNIDRGAVTAWRTSTFDAHTAFPSIGTQVTSTTIRPMLNYILSRRSRGTRYADLLVMSEEHYFAYDAATVAIQRIAKEGRLAGLGFSALEYIGGGKKAEIVLASGLNTNMPSNTTYGIETASLGLRYREDFNFTPLFDGDGQKPINQDAIAQFLGWEGEMVLTNPLFTWRFYDSNPAA